MLDCIATQKQSITETDVGNELQQINNDDATQHTDANKAATSMMDTLRSKIVSVMSVQRHYTFKALLAVSQMLMINHYRYDSSICIPGLFLHVCTSCPKPHKT